MDMLLSYLLCKPGAYRLSLLRYKQVPKFNSEQLDCAGEGQHGTAPVFVRDLGPNLESDLGCGDGIVKVVLGRDGNLGHGFKSGWVITTSGSLRGGALAVDDLYKIALEVYFWTLLTMSRWRYGQFIFCRAIRG